MSNPLHTPRVEAEMVALEAVKRAHGNLDAFIQPGATPAYRRDVLNALAARYNKMLDASGADGMFIPETATIQKD